MASMGKTYEELLAENRTQRNEITLLRAELAGVRSQLAALVGLATSQNERLGELTDVLRRRPGTKLPPERVAERKPEDDDPDPEPPEGGATGIAAPGSDEAPAGAAGTGPKRKPRTKGGRRPISDRLEVDDEHHRAPLSCPCCGETRLLARDVEVSEKIDVRPYVRRRRIVREVRVCSRCNVRVTAPMPPMPSERSKFTCDFLAWIVYQKFYLLVPLDRIHRALASQGVDVPMPTLVYLIEKAADLLGPIDGQHWKELKAGPYLATDGTGLDVQLPYMKKVWHGCLDIFTRDELAVYQFSMTKHGDGLAAKLSAFKGTVLCDAESRLDAMFSDERVEANCNAHPRRKFRDAEQAQPKLAAEASAFMQQMYDVERDAKLRGLVGVDLLAERQARTRPVVDRFKDWLVAVEPTLVPSDPLGKAVRYYLNHFQALTRFIDDADIPIDNNRSERGFQNHAKLRLNALFAGSQEGAHRWATCLGVVETAKRHGLDVFAYLTWAFERRGTWRKVYTMSAADLTPAAYKRAIAELSTEAA
jgi:transposase